LLAYMLGSGPVASVTQSLANKARNVPDCMAIGPLLELEQ